MAKAPTTGRKFTIGNSVRSRTVALVAARDRRRITQETTFQTAVAEKNLSLTEQLAYREEQLKREKKSSARDNKYILDLKKDVGILQKAMASERLRDSYLKSYNAWLAGSQPVEFHISEIKKQLNATNDPTMRGQLQTALSSAIKEQKRVDDALISNFVTFAANDKTISVLDKALDSVRKEKARAVARGDDERVSLMNIKEQTLNQARATAVIVRKTHNLDLARTRTKHPVRTLDAFEDAISQADGSANIVVNGISYTNEREFWELQRGNYIANGTFAQDYKDYYGTWSKNAVDTRPELLVDVAGQIKDATTLLVTRPELQQQSEYILGLQNDVLGKAIDSAAQDILNQARIDFDFVGAAGRMDALGKATGIDVAPFQNQIIADIATLKAPVTQEILATAQALVEKGVGFESAMAQARAKFREGEIFAKAISPKELAEGDPGEVLEGENVLPTAPPPPTEPPPPVEGVETKPAEKVFVPPAEEKKPEVEVPVEPPKQKVTAPAVGVGSEFPEPPEEKKEETNA